jgi:DNA polymerase IV (archaeal DinB-like DNA polymerase)
MQKAIALLDLDYFYAQCEQLRRPEFKGFPLVIVMPSLRENSGAIATANYEARAMKIRSGMPLSLAKKLADNRTVFINADKPYYEELSKKVFETVDFFCDKVEQVSIDEAYLDLTNPLGFEKAKEICFKIKKSIKIETGLTCSIGLSYNKVLAKIASNEKKPDGFFVVDEVEPFLSKKKIRNLFGVGPKSEKIFKEHSIHFVGDIKKHSREEIVEWFGEAKGSSFYDFAFGKDERLVIPNREKQQISRMITLKEDSRDIESVLESLNLLSELVFAESKKIGKKFKTASLIIITPSFETITKSKTKAEINSLEKLFETEEQLLKDFLNDSLQKIRRLGVRVSNFNEDVGMQKTLFEFK